MSQIENVTQAAGLMRDLSTLLQLRNNWAKHQQVSRDPKIGIRIGSDRDVTVPVTTILVLAMLDQEIAAVRTELASLGVILA